MQKISSFSGLTLIISQKLEFLARNAEVSFSEKLHINSLNKQKHGNLVHREIDNSINCKSGIVWCWQLKISLTVSLVLFLYMCNLACMFVCLLIGFVQFNLKYIKYFERIYEMSSCQFFYGFYTILRESRYLRK